MTRGEIKSGLSALATQFNPFSEESKLMLGAVEALEQAPCENAISRQAVIDGFWTLDVKLSPSAIDAILNMIEHLPPVTPKDDRQDLIDSISKLQTYKLYKDGEKMVRLDKVIAILEGRECE